MDLCWSISTCIVFSGLQFIQPVHKYCVQDCKSRSKMTHRPDTFSIMVISKTGNFSAHRRNTGKADYHGGGRQSEPHGAGGPDGGGSVHGPAAQSGEQQSHPGHHHQPGASAEPKAGTIQPPLFCMSHIKLVTSSSKDDQTHRQQDGCSCPAQLAKHDIRTARVRGLNPPLQRFLPMKVCNEKHTLILELSVTRVINGVNANQI